LGAKLQLRIRLNERLITKLTPILADCPDRPTKRTFERRRKLVCTVNLQQELANLLVSVAKLLVSRSNIQLVVGSPEQRYQARVFHDAASFREKVGIFFVRGFCHASEDARLVIVVDMQLS